MSVQSKWKSHFQENKTMFIMLAVGLFLIELEIFAMAVMKSGPESHLQVLDQQDLVVFESKNTTLDGREKSEFERTFGPLTNFRVNLVTTQRPFPIRPWFAAAVGFPIGAVLLFGFFIKAYETLFFRNEPSQPETSQSHSPVVDGWDRLFLRISRLNIFAIGTFVLLFAFGLWAVPQLVAELGRHGAELITRYKWVAIGAVAIFLGFAAWIIFLRYLLARKSIETQADVEKYRLQLELMGDHKTPRQLPSPDQPPLALPRQSISDPSDKLKDDRPS